MTRLIVSLLAAAAVLLVAAPNAVAQERSLSDSPRLLSYQGYLADLSGLPVPNGEYLVTMRLYDVPEAGKALWEEELKVSAYDGFFDAYLGLQTPLNLPFDRPYWLAAQLRGEAEMTPRTLLALAPYAFRSLVAEKAAALAPGADGAVTGLNGAQGEVTIIGGEGVQVSRSGDTIMISAVPTTGGEGSVAVGSGSEGLEAKKIVQTDEANGVITLALGGGDLMTRPPVAGSFQHLGGVVVKNPYVTERSLVHVTVLDKKDDGAAPNPEASLYLVDVDNRSAGSFTLRIGMIPTGTSSSNFQRGDSISIGYTIVNASR